MENNMGNTMKKKDDNVTQLSEYKGFQALQKSVGGLATITDEKLAVIAEKMVAIDRANHTAGRSQTQTTNQLMSLTMMTDSPYRRLRQCMSQIERKRTALEESYFKMQKKQLQIKLWYEKGDEMSVVRAKEAESGMIRQKDYIDAAFKEIATFQCAYDEIRESHNIPENWDEKDAELAEIDHHIKQAFRQAHRDMVNTGRIGLGNMEYLEQYGIHIQTATKIIADYITSEDEMISEGKLPTVKHLYAFLDRMAETFHDAHKDVMNRIGIKELIKEDFLYLENKDDIS
jgi:predicted Fe-Mo cluster-binding NifX family protein